MSQAGYTPIQLYFSTTAAAVPVNTNLANGELAINITDGKLYYKDNGGTVRLLASNATSAPVLSFQTSLSGLTPSTATSGVVTLAGTLGAASGGTGLTTLATGSLTYGAGTSAFSTLAIGTAGQVLTVNSGATAPQWSTLTGVAVTTFSAGTTGFTPSSATAGAITLAGTLATTNGGTGLTSFTSGGVVYASSTSALTTNSALTFDGSTLALTGVQTITNSGGSTLILDRTSNPGSLQFNFGGTQTGQIQAVSGGGLVFYQGSSPTEGMRLTSTGLGIGTSSPAVKLHVASSNSTTYSRVDSSAYRIYVGAESDGNAIYSQTLAGSDALLRFYTASTERMRLDASGNLGLGVTPSAWNTSYRKAMQLFTGGSIAGGDGPTFVSVAANTYLDSTSAYKYIGTGQATRFEQQTGEFTWHTAGSGTAGNTATFAQVMTLSNAGNVALSASVPSAFGATYRAFQPAGYAAYAGDSYYGRAEILNNAYASNIDVFNYYDTNAAGRYSMQLGAHMWFRAGSGTAGSVISFTQAMTLTTAGQLLLGTTSALATSRRELVMVGGDGALVSLGNTTNADRFQITSDSSENALLINKANAPMIFYTNNTQRFQIGASGQLGIGGATYGTAGQVLTSGGSGAAPTWTTVGAGLAAATQAEMEAASSNTVAATPSNTKYHPGVAKVWVIANTSGTIGGSYNVASVTDEGVGKLLVTYVTAFSSVNYSLNMSIVGGSAYAYWFEQGSSNYAVGSCRAYVMTFAGQYQDPGSSYLVSGFGDQ
jgi:hypothetical protein